VTLTDWQGRCIRLVCLSGGPMRNPVYPGGLGGLSAWLRETPGSSPRRHPRTAPARAR